MKDEYSHFEMMQAKHFIINTEVREAKKKPSKAKTSEQIEADVAAFKLLKLKGANDERN